MIGTTLSHFKITAKLGEGGMGEVYRATDTKLGREVAIKMLPEALAGDAERLARFEREAKVLASLNHPNIAGIHQVEQDDGLNFLVMELAEGEDLAERLARAPLSVDEALSVALQITKALEAAHEKGIVHRDLKPANVMVADGGQTKVLDFGLAKAWEVEPGGADSLSMSPTLTAQMTQAGVILGTAAYMSPEQARGQEVDKQADIWAFGCVLYEMLVGKRTFRGETVTDTLAAILERTPDLQALPDEVPRAVRRLLERCLEKEPADRLHHIGDARLELMAASRESVAGPSDHPLDRSRRQVWAGWATALLLGAILGGLGVQWFAPSEQPAGPNLSSATRRSSIALPEGVRLAGSSDMPLASLRPMVAISPDGGHIVYGAIEDGAGRLVIRALDSFEERILPGTVNAYNPFFSPDGDWLAFFDRDKLMKISIQGGEPVIVAEVGTPNGGAWGDDGFIYFVHHEVRLARVSEDGGSPEDISDEVVADPSVLPLGRGVLVSRDTFSSVSKSTFDVVLLEAGADSAVVVEGGYSARYVPSGHLVFMRRGELLAAPFDLESLSIRQPPQKVLDSVATSSEAGASQFSFSNGGTLVYAQGGDWSVTIPSWVDRQGNVDALSIPPQVHGHLSLSPDGTRLAIQVAAGPEDDIYVYDLVRETFVRLTLQGGDLFPIWTADGQEVIFSSARNGRSNPLLYRKAVDGTSPAAPVLSAEQLEGLEDFHQFPSGVSPDGRWLLFNLIHPERGFDIMLAPLEGGQPRPLVATDASEVLGSVSPDGRWVAFLSDRTGRYEVYVRPFPDGDQEWQISSGGGDDPRWSPTGEELFYLDGAILMSVRYSSNEDFEVSKPLLVLETDLLSVPGLSFDVSGDGQRFLVNRPVDAGTTTTRLHLVSNWFEELKELVPID